MSTLKVDTIQKADGTGSLSVPAESGTVVTTASPSLGRRNLIINGAMQVAQRGDVTGITGSSYGGCDRWELGANALGTWTIAQVEDAPSGSGFHYSQKITCTSGDGSLGSSDFLRLRMKFEGTELQHLSYGTSSAKDLTLSFWVKSNKTGSFNAQLRNSPSTGSRIAGGLISISSADTWEFKTITISGDTSSVIDNNNQAEMFLAFWLNAGSTYSGTDISTTWSDFSNANFYGNATLGLGGATNDYFAITGVQLEVGSVATPFEHRSYGEELALCQRYFTKSFNDGVTPVAHATDGLYANGSCAVVNNVFGINQDHRVCMRTTPTVTLYPGSSTSGGSSGQVGFYNGSWSNISCGVQNVDGDKGFSLSATPTLSLNASFLIMYNYTADAEL